MDYIKEAEEIFEEAKEIRRYLHMHPELSEEEYETKKYITDFLDRHNIKYYTGENDNSIVAEAGKDPSKAVGIRADFDALPITEDTGLPYASCTKGVMHACGHDMHTAILMCTAAILKKHEDKIPGTVKFFFQPAEETIGGAEPMIKSGCLKNPETDVVIALHVDPSSPSGNIVLKYGPMNAAATGFSIVVRGKGCHGAHPDMGVDPVVVSASIILALQSISSRFNAPTTPVIVTVGSIHGGSAGNVIPETVTLSGTVRALDNKTFRDTINHVNEIASFTAKSYGAEAEVKWADDFYPPLINNNEVTKVLENTAKELFGESKVELMEEPSLGADDFSFFTEAAKASYFNMGTAIKGEPFYPLHSEKMNPDETTLKTGIAMFTASVFSLLGENSLFIN